MTGFRFSSRPTLIVGGAAAFYYAAAGLTLSHYDARAHLVVARRIIDSLTPGWQQIGAVWLPLPHLLNMLPVQVDALYRTGASAIAISVISIAAATWALSAVILRTTGSLSGAVTARAAAREPERALPAEHADDRTAALRDTAAGDRAHCRLDDYDIRNAWPARAGAALARAVPDAVRGLADCGGDRSRSPASCCIAARHGRLSMRSVLRARWLRGRPSRSSLFLINSRWTVGTWFVSGGFFVPGEHRGDRHIRSWRGRRFAKVSIDCPGPCAGLVRLRRGARSSSSRASARDRERRSALLLALAAAAALPCCAYTQGHPFRIRYDVPLVAACAALAGAGIGLLWSRLRPLVAVDRRAAALVQAPPLDREAPLIAESQRDAANRGGPPRGHRPISSRTTTAGRS